MERVDFKKKSPWKFFFAYFFNPLIKETCCRMLQRLYWLFQCSRNTRWVVSSYIGTCYNVMKYSGDQGCMLLVTLARVSSIYGRRFTLQLSYEAWSFYTVQPLYKTLYCIKLNTQYMRNSTITYLFKMEYRWKSTIFGLIMSMKIGLRKYF